MATLYLLVILLSGQPVALARDIPTAACNAVAERALSDLIAQPGVASVSIMCVPQGSAA